MTDRFGTTRNNHLTATPGFGTPAVYAGPGADILRDPPEGEQNEPILMGGYGNDTYLLSGAGGFVIVAEFGNDPLDRLNASALDDPDTFFEWDGHLFAVAEEGQGEDRGILVANWQDPASRIERWVIRNEDGAVEEVSHAAVTQLIRSSDEYQGVLNDAQFTDFVNDGEDADELSPAQIRSLLDRAEAQDIGFNDDIAIGAVARLFFATLGRLPDEEGLAFWLSRVQGDGSLPDIARGFIESAEFESNFGSNLSDLEFVDALYLNVLGRAADQGGRDFWVDTLAQGSTRDAVVIEFAESPENQVNVDPLIGDLIVQTLGRGETVIDPINF